MKRFLASLHNLHIRDSRQVLTVVANGIRVEASEPTHSHAFAEDVVMSKGKNRSQHAKLPTLAASKHNGRSNEDDARRAAITMQSKTGTSGRPTDRRIETALRIMRRQDGRSLSIRELARQVNLSACHFTHLFRSEMAISPKQYIRVLRIEQARELLIDSFWTVKQVASMVGSGDRSHFCRHFKSVFGQAPSDFRRSEQLGLK